MNLEEAALATDEPSSFMHQGLNTLDNPVHTLVNPEDAALATDELSSVMHKGLNALGLTHNPLKEGMLVFISEQHPRK